MLVRCEHSAAETRRALCHTFLQDGFTTIILGFTGNKILINIYTISLEDVQVQHIEDSSEILVGFICY